jgi:hypothetical protein
MGMIQRSGEEAMNGAMQMMRDFQKALLSQEVKLRFFDTDVLPALVARTQACERQVQLMKPPDFSKVASYAEHVYQLEQELKTLRSEVKDLVYYKDFYQQQKENNDD